MSPWIWTLTFGAAVGSGLIAGVFLAFSTFVMQALSRLTPPQGVLAMQSINRTVLNPIFLGIFLGTAAVGVLLVGSALWQWQEPKAAYRIAGGLLYVIGTFSVTIARNVPMNEALARVDSGSDEARHLWALYRRHWTAWNHVRTLTALLAAGAFTIALP